MEAKVATEAKKKGPSLQDEFLSSLRDNKTTVSIYLVNGIKLIGRVEAFDPFVVLLTNSVNQLIYKHAISTVVPGEVAQTAPSPGRSEPEVTYRRREPGFARKSRM